MVKVVIANSAGVCFGVNRALNLLEKTTHEGVAEGKKVAMLGPLIHNPRLIKSYEQKNVHVATVDEISENTKVVMELLPMKKISCCR